MPDFGGGLLRVDQRQIVVPKGNAQSILIWLLVGLLPILLLLQFHFLVGQRFGQTTQHLSGQIVQTADKYLLLGQHTLGQEVLGQHLGVRHKAILLCVAWQVTVIRTVINDAAFRLHVCLYLPIRHIEPIGSPPPRISSSDGLPLEVITWAVWGLVRVPRIGFCTVRLRKLCISRQFSTLSLRLSVLFLFAGKKKTECQRGKMC